MQTREACFIIGALALVTGLGIGYGMGVVSGVRVCVDKGIEFLTTNNLDLGVLGDFLKSKI